MDEIDEIFTDATHSHPSANGSIPPDIVAQAAARTSRWLLAHQQPDGHWVGELEGDTILESEYLLLLAFLNRHTTPVARKAASYLVEKQLPDGGWALYPGGKLDISASVKAYFTLKLTGHDPSAPHMQRAREAILAHGGADAVNSFTRYYLALLGQISYEQCPAVPPELVLMPKWFPVNLYRMSAWTRTILVPLSLMWAHRPVRRIDPRLGIRELFLRHPQDWPPLVCPGKEFSTRLFSWDRFFRATDRWMKRAEHWGITPLRRRAIDAAKAWMLERFDGSDGVGAIFPPIIWSVVALKAMGYADDSEEVQYNLRQLDDLIIEEGDTVRLQPCRSPVWDTAISLRALADSGHPADTPAVRAATRWLLDRQIKTPGDWSRTVKAEPGAWCFEYHNRYYPDLDDTAMVVAALCDLHDALGAKSASSNGKPASHFLDAGRTDDPSAARRRALLLTDMLAATETASAWLVAMQNRDGGWGAFDKDNDWEFLCRVPFADHNAMIDPSTPDLAARIVETLGKLGRRLGDPAVDRAVAYIRRSQQPDGSWFGRWGVNYVYGTWQALVGLTAVGVSRHDPTIVAGANWLLAYQQADGGWGESPDSYADPRLRGRGPTTASQTAWAVMGLIAAGLAKHPAALRGVRWLVDRQQPDGTWDEPQFTGTGFPLVFYLRYHLYPIYFPLMALGRWRRAVGGRQSAVGGEGETAAKAAR